MTLSIGQVAGQAGVRTSAIRYYEEIGILPVAERVGGRRRYPDTAVDQLRVIRFAQAAGLSLDEIRVLFHGFGADVPPAQRWQELATSRLAELDRQVEQLGRMRRALESTLSCSCLRIEDCAGDGVSGTGCAAL
jgi:MerR family transcriptional regulator, redox-sensitive transcriptional activator SoxR